MLAAGHRSRRQFEQRMLPVAEEVRRAGDIILFLDDLHRWAAHETVLSYLTSSRGDIRCCISATTAVEFSRILDQGSPLGRFFTPVPVDPLSTEEVFAVLLGLRDRYAAHHRVVIQDEALRAAVALAAGDRGALSLVDRALDLLDEAAAEVRLRNRTPAPDLADLDARISQLQEEKEARVVEQDFERAAHARDQADQLQKRKETLVREWREQANGIDGVVDAEVVREVGRTM
jgi:ATP-dependent Clp protease ATP-binding subunit ClpC